MKSMPIQLLPADSFYEYQPDSDTWIVKKKSGNLVLSKKDIKAYEGGYPTEDDSVQFGMAPPGWMATEPWKKSEQENPPKNISDLVEYYISHPHKEHGRIVDLSIKDRTLTFEDKFVISFDDINNIVPKPDRGSDSSEVNDYSQNLFFGPNDLGRSHQHSPADSGWAPAGTEDLEGPGPNERMSSFKSFMCKSASLNKINHCGVYSLLKIESLHILIDLYYKDNSLFPKEVIEELSLATTELKVDNFNDILESVITEYLEEKAGEVGDKLPKLKNLLITLKDITPKLGKEITVVDKQASSILDVKGKQVYHNPTQQQVLYLFSKAKYHVLRGLIDPVTVDYYVWDANDLTHDDVGEFLGIALPSMRSNYYKWYAIGQFKEDREGYIQDLYQRIEKAKKFKVASLNKQANPPSRFWIAPDGKEFASKTIHPVWIKNNYKILEQYGFQTQGKEPHQLYDEMVNSGWIRISNETRNPFSIQVPDLRHIPPFLDNFITKYFNPGDRIVIGTGKSENFAVITDPFPSLQKAVNEELMNSKQASLLDEVLDQTTQDAIAAEYGPNLLVALRFYNDAVNYGQSSDRAMAYALEEIKRMHRPIEQKNFLEVLNTYF